MFGFQDPVEEFAKGLKTFPTHKDDPREVYDRLMNTAQPTVQSVAVQTTESQPDDPVTKRLEDYSAEELQLTNMKYQTAPPDQFWNNYFEPLQSCSWYPSKGS